MLAEDYVQIEQTIRQAHLQLDEPCYERGGISTNHRGVLAQYLDTPIYGRPALLCHACHNEKCSNPKHLYWGTAKENTADALANGTFKTPWEYKVEKYGYDEAVRLNAKGNKSAGGKGNKGKPKSAEHRRKISESLRARGENGDTRES